MKCLAKETYRRYENNLWMSQSKKYPHLCTVGLCKYVHIPRTAKRLYISIWDKPPSRKRSNLIKVDVVHSPISAYWWVDAEEQYISHIVRPVLRRLSEQHEVDALFVSFEWS